MATFNSILNAQNWNNASAWNVGGGAYPGQTNNDDVVNITAGNSIVLGAGMSVSKNLGNVTILTSGYLAVTSSAQLNFNAAGQIFDSTGNNTSGSVQVANGATLTLWRSSGAASAPLIFANRTGNACNVVAGGTLVCNLGGITLNNSGAAVVCAGNLTILNSGNNAVYGATNTIGNNSVYISGSGVMNINGHVYQTTTGAIGTAIVHNSSATGSLLTGNVTSNGSSSAGMRVYSGLVTVTGNLYTIGGNWSASPMAISVSASGSSVELRGNIWCANSGYGYGIHCDNNCTFTWNNSTPRITSANADAIISGNNAKIYMQGVQLTVGPNSKLLMIQRGAGAGNGTFNQTGATINLQGPSACAATMGQVVDGAGLNLRYSAPRITGTGTPFLGIK